MMMSFGRGYGVSDGPHISRERRDAVVGVPEPPDKQLKLRESLGETEFGLQEEQKPPTKGAVSVDNT